MQSLRLAMKRCIDLGEVGLQVAAYLGDRLVIDESIGYADADGSRLVDSSTLFPIFSVTKILPILAIHLQVDRGLVDYDSPVARYWPEFGANGKGDITIRHVLSHRAGVPNMPDAVTIDNVGDWDWITSQLANLTPLFPANSRSSYLSYTFGWILGEVVKRTDPRGRPFRAFIEEELLRPLAVEDFFLGLPDAEANRVATVLAPGSLQAPDSDAPYGRVALPRSLEPGAIFNDRRLQRAVFPSAGGIANARSVARLMALPANHGQLGTVRLLSEARVSSFTELRECPYERDLVIGRTVVMSWSGFRVGSNHPNREAVIGTSPHVLEHSGSGGTVAWADLDGCFSAAICHNRMFRPDYQRPDTHPFAPIGEAIRTWMATRPTEI